MTDHVRSDAEIEERLATLAQALQWLAPRAGGPSRLVGELLRTLLHQAVTVPCPACGQLHRGFDLDDGTVVQFACATCRTPFEVAVEGLGAFAVTACEAPTEVTEDTT